MNSSVSFRGAKIGSVSLELRDAAGARVDTEWLMVGDNAPSDLPLVARIACVV